jgi:hypothetical protein
MSWSKISECQGRAKMHDNVCKAVGVESLRGGVLLKS